MPPLLLEHATVHNRFRYGTPREPIERALEAGKTVLLEIDLQGARQVRSSGIPSIGIFVLPPSAQILEQRLRGRSKDAEAAIRKRLEVACSEVGEFAAYEYVVVNDELDTAVERLRAIVLAERARVQVMQKTAENIITTFKGRRA